jgi:fructan beta-fructosidase
MVQSVNIMRKIINIVITPAFLFLMAASASAQSLLKMDDKPYRPQIHFSPAANWMNDPNGMVYSNGVYHLFFQYNPNSSVWGPMHWGHATSRDLIHWNHEPIALYPDSLGTIFSGSAVVDKNNTSGFGKNGQIPLVAIFTSHDEKGAKEGRNNFQNQSLAYSLDNGMTWTKYSQNPVLKNPGIMDFRDPKVMWFEKNKKWVMTLATKDHITFYSSKDLKSWIKESEFGATIGAHGGVWECPDLFLLDDKGKKVWVLIVNLNPGGPNKGSATQYFLGDFDGNKFIPYHKETKWLDYGPDEYAGITWSNTGNRKIFLGWMSNWIYANVVPTETWRNAMTIPRELKLTQVGKDMFISSQPVTELSTIQSKPIVASDIKINKRFDIAGIAGKVKFPCRINLQLEEIKDLSLTISNTLGEEVVIGYDKKKNQYFIDRTQSGKTGFEKEFAGRSAAPRFSHNGKMNISLVIDVSSVELFADDGLTVMTAIFFPNKPYDQIHIQSPAGALIKKMEYISLNSIWNSQ